MNTEICETENPKQGWARPDGVLRYAPFGRTTLYDLINRNVIESYVIGNGKPGGRRCVRLINLASLDSYIRDPQAAELRAAGGKQHGEVGGHYARDHKYYERQELKEQQKKQKHPTLGSL